MTKYLAAGIVLLALACADKDAGPVPATAPDAGHRFVESEEPAKPEVDREPVDTATRPEQAIDAAEAREPTPATEELERAANHEQEAPVPPPAEIH